MQQDFKDSFSNLVESMKRSQRADLIDGNDSILDKLYTDPFDGDLLIKQMLNDQTSLLIGRKGTGKSTLINKFQHEIRLTEDKISLYIDVRTIFSKSNDSRENITLEQSLNDESQKNLTLYKVFIRKIIDEIKIEINKNIFEGGNWSSKIKRILGLSKQLMTESEFITKLDSILENALTPHYEDITGHQLINKSQENTNKISNREDANGDIGLSINNLPSLNLSRASIDERESNQHNTDSYSLILKREFNISNITDDLKKLLQHIGIQKVYLCLDDCSELDKASLETFIKTLVAPLHNNSDGFFRFKVAFYPERNVLPEIDRTKIDTLFLDYYEMYKSSGADKVEEQAINYIKRLIRNRIGYYFSGEPISEIESSIFDTKNTTIDEYYKLIFYACSCVARNIGRLLFYANKKSISSGKPITKSVIQESAQEQYVNEIEPLIIKDEFFQYKSYSELYKRTQLKDLVSKIIQKARDNKKHIGNSNAEIFKKYNSSNAPSHFLYVRNEISQYLSTLEINNFLTRISVQKDKGGYVNSKFQSNDIVVYTLNYGLCQKENIIFEEIKDRKYRIERVFDFNALLEEWAKSSAYVICNNCNAEYDISEWEKISDFDFYCRQCKTSDSCVLRNNARTDTSNEKESNLSHINLKPEQLRIIHSLYIEDNLTENQLAGELDVSHMTVRAYLRNDRVLRKDGWVCKNDLTLKFTITEKSMKEIYNVFN